MLQSPLLVIQTQGVTFRTEYTINTSIQIYRSAAGVFSQTYMTWNDSSSNASCVARYNLSGLLPSTKYYVSRNGVEDPNGLLTSDASGYLPLFNATLAQEQMIGVSTTHTSVPRVDLNAPGTGSVVASGVVAFNYTANDTYLSWCVLYHNHSGVWLSNLTNSSPVSGQSSTFTLNLTADRSFVWNVWCNDSAGNSAFNATNYSLTIDTTAPSVSLSSPQNGSEQSRLVVFNYTVIDPNLAACILYHNHSGVWLSNLTNSSLVSGQASTFVVNFTSDSSFVWNVWCNDTVGNGAFNGTNYSLTINAASSNVIITLLNGTFDSLTPGTSGNTIIDSLRIQNTGTLAPSSGLLANFTTNLSTIFGFTNDTFVINASNFRLNNTALDPAGDPVAVSQAADIPAGIDINWSASIDIPPGQGAKIYKGTILISWVV
jgi:hypothetical protein